MKYALMLSVILGLAAAQAQTQVTVNPDRTVSVNGAKVFPISVYLQSDWAGARQLGVNTASRPFCVNAGAPKQAEHHGLYLHYTAGPGCDSANAAAIKARNAAPFTQSVNQAKGSKALLGYGLPDEPQTAMGLSAADTRWAYGVIKAADPHHLVFLTEYASDITAHRESADVFLNDEYPFNNAPNPLYDIKTRLKTMQAQVAPKPVWLIIQAGSQFGMPTNAQIRAETYLSIALGSTGLVFYSYDVEDANAVHNIRKDGDPAFLTQLISELTSLSPVLLGATNTALVYSASHVDAIRKDHAGKTYLIAVNKSASAQDISFSLGGVKNATATLVGLSSAGSQRVGQTRAVSADGTLTDRLQGLEAAIYEIGASTGAGIAVTSEAGSWSDLSAATPRRPPPAFSNSTIPSSPGSNQAMR